MKLKDFCQIYAVTGCVPVLVCSGAAVATGNSGFNVAGIALLGVQAACLVAGIFLPDR